jgi:hypothetical protein
MDAGGGTTFANFGRVTHFTCRTLAAAILLRRFRGAAVSCDTLARGSIGPAHIRPPIEMLEDVHA